MCSRREGEDDGIHDTGDRDQLASGRSPGLARAPPRGALEPDLPIVDPHHHLMDRPESGRYLLTSCWPTSNSGHNIVATVYLECRSMYRADGPEELRPVGETEFVNGVAAMSASGGYGRRASAPASSATPTCAGRAAWPRCWRRMIVAGGGRFRGIRYISAWDPRPGPMGRRRSAGRRAGCSTTQFREGFAQLAPLGLSFDAWLYHPQLGELTDWRGPFPATPIVLDHVGGPLGIGRYAGRRDEVFADWSARIRELAACPNVHVKLGGLGMQMFGFDLHEGELPPTSEQLAAAWRPYVETCIEAFGAEPRMFESNFPVDKGSYSYAVFWNACKRLAQGASATEKADLFHGTASRFYRLDI